MNQSFSYFQPWSSTLQAPLLYLWWSPGCTGWCWHHLCAVVRARQVWGGSGTCQWSRLSYGPEVYGWVHAASAPSTHRPVTQHHRPPLHRSAGPWARPVVPRSVPLDRSYILFFSFLSENMRMWICFCLEAHKLHSCPKLYQHVPDM